MAPTLRAQVAPSRATTPATARLPAPTKMMAPPPAPARRSPTSPASRPSVAASAATPWNPMPPAGTVLASAYGSVPPAEPSGRRAGEEGHEGMRGHDHTHAARTAHLFLCVCVLTDARLLPLFTFTQASSSTRPPCPARPPPPGRTWSARKQRLQRLRPWRRAQTTQHRRPPHTPTRHQARPSGAGPGRSTWRPGPCAPAITRPLPSGCGGGRGSWRRAGAAPPGRPWPKRWRTRSRRRTGEAPGGGHPHPRRPGCGSGWRRLRET